VGEGELRAVNSSADERATRCLEEEITRDERAGHHAMLAAADTWTEKAFLRALRVENLYDAWSRARIEARLASGSDGGACLGAVESHV
jgi:hypothetical protein